MYLLNYKLIITDEFQLKVLGFLQLTQE